MSCTTIYLNNVEPYLKQWFIHEQGGEYPVNLVRGSIESNMLFQFLINKKTEEPPIIDDRTLAINIPSFKKRDPRTYNYLPPMAKVALHKCIKNRFDVQMWNDLHQFSNLGMQIDDLIYAWMEKHGIELSETNWNAIAKRYQRKRKTYLNNIVQKNARLRAKKFTMSSPSSLSSLSSSEEDLESSES